jgi:hypothetical protein
MKRGVDFMNKELSPEAKRQAAVEKGVFSLTAFYNEYEKNRFGPRTEFYRGQISVWRQMLEDFYGESAADRIVEEASRESGLSIPHCGPLSSDGKAYLGSDAGCHPFIGKLSGYRRAV